MTHDIDASDTLIRGRERNSNIERWKPIFINPVLNRSFCGNVVRHLVTTLLCRAFGCTVI